ncbi:hypothetical protein JW933_11630 [candidate division FCPU426 bacterium]|nr:hypothetical protein [candidate division FCPU426 bacterium]
MSPLVHVSVSLAGGFCLAGVSGSWTAALYSCLSGVLLDVDHGCDYFFARKQWVSAPDFFRFWKDFSQPHLYLPLHSMEWLLLLGAAAWLGWAPAVTGGLAFGMLHHLLVDQWGNGVHPGGYWLIMRGLWKFSSKKILRWGEAPPKVQS